MDGIKGYDLDMTVVAAIMCLGIVLGSRFIMVAGGGVRWVKLSFSLLPFVAQEGFMCQCGREMLALSLNRM